MVICQGLLPFSVFLEEPQTELLSCRPMTCLCPSLQGNPGFIFSTNGLRPALQSELCDLDTAFTKTGLTRNLGATFCYKRWPPLCLGGTQLRLLPKSMSPGCNSFAHINAFYSLLQSKINFWFTNRCSHKRKHNRGSEKQFIIFKCPREGRHCTHRVPWERCQGGQEPGGVLGPSLGCLRERGGRARQAD